MRLIDAEKLQKHFENCIVECKNTNSYSEDFEIALSATKNQPTIETESVRYVKWIHGEEWIAHCSECGEEMLSTDISNYCPKCGVKMEEKMSFKIAEIKTLEAEIENLAYEKPFGEYAIFKNGFFKLNDKGIKIIHDTSELICSHWGANQWCHHFICELLDLYSGSSEFNCSLGTYKHQKELPQCWNNNTETVIKWFNKHSNKLWYKLAEKSFNIVMLTIQYDAKDLNT